ncbi:hypothetical protein [Alkalihalobacillus sp. LMS39]|uniref:tetratricopeptide repeat protein n=1 Tax=Alkalihalobacillus sp. LMS39 TaxID=2924032 RepID=UPI001FB1E4D2|nr:hypothetical protein [Alkalihalobacillus sp. LMS39]UOE95135.1 hypothetical protein MM271_05785 [Alkalihalobacillus sp. LMS39]
MKKMFCSSLFLLIILMGCNDEAYNNAIEKGLDYIASEEFQKAEGAFELALGEKKDDGKATALLEQTKLYQEALEAFEDANFEKATDKSELVMIQTEGSNALIKKAEEILSAIEGLQTTLTEITEKYELAMQYYEENEYEKSTITLEELLSTNLSHPIFHTVQKDVEALQNDIETAVIAKENEEREKAEREAAIEAQEQKEQQTTKINLTADQALNIIKNLYDWPSTTTFDLNPTVIEWGEESYYGIYVDTHVDESNSSKSSLLVDANDGSVYDNSRGDLIPVN